MANNKFVVKNGLQTSNINFVSPNQTNTITALMLDSDTLSFSGNSGELFSITDSLSGTIFSVNDISGIPSIEVFDTGNIKLAELSGNVGIGTTSPAYKLDVTGTSGFNGLVQITNNKAIDTTTPGLINYGLHFNGQLTADYAAGITWNGGTGTTGAQAGIYVQGSSAYGTKMYLATTDNYTTGAKTAISISQGGVTNFVRARPTALGNTILDAGNYNSYAPTLTGTGASGTWGISITGNAATVTNGVYTTGDQTISGKKNFTPTVATGTSTEVGLRIAPNSLAGAAEWRNMLSIRSNYNGGANGHAFYIKANASNQFEMVADWSTQLRLGVITNDGSAANATAAKYLTLTTAGITWDSNTLLDAGNYNTYAPTLTGTGASGTWGISVTGSAGSVAWSGITSKPTTISGYGITDTVSQLLTGYAVGTNTALAATDSIVGAFGKVQGQLDAKAPLASPALSGTPTAPTAAVGTDTTQIATTAFVNAEIANDAPTKTGGGASGTWGISVTGNAATATNVAWSGITSKPTTISGYGITDTVSQALTGYTVGANTALADTDTIVGAFGKVQGQLNAKQGSLTLTTTGTSGAATLIGNTLNIPQYSGSTTPPGGSDTQVQFNDGGAFGGSTGFTYNKTTSTATVTNLTVPGTVSLDTNSLAIGTDASITDIDTAHTLGVVSQTNSAVGYIKFGTGSALGYNGTNLVYGANIVLNAGNYNTYSPTLTGTGASGNWGINITGSAATLTTARTLTIGATGKTFNGSANVSWSLTEIGAVGTSGNETIAGNKTFSGTTALASGSTINGLVIGYRDIPQNIQNANYTLTLGDAGEMVGKDNTTAYTYTIPANSVTAFPVGTAITFFNGNATSNITIAINTDTLRLAGTTTTGSRTLAPWGLATAVKIASTVWLINGSGLT